MNITYIVGVLVAIVVMLFGMVTKIDFAAAQVLQISFKNLINFFDAASILIAIITVYNSFTNN